MPGLKDVKNKIEGVSKTSQITKAMNMVASAKLRGAQERMETFRPYAKKFAEAMEDLSGSMSGNQPLMEVRDVQAVELIVVTSDRGLCGSFNAHIVSRAQQLIDQLEAEGKEVSLITVGNKAAQAFKRSGKIRASYKDIMGTFQMFNAREISGSVTLNFLSGEVDEVRVVYAHFFSMAKQRPTEETLLPIKPPEQGEGGKSGTAVEYIYEPSPTEIMEALLPLHLNVQVYHAMIEVAAGEHAARMAAMDNATNACGDIIKDLTQLYNKARQAAITGDLMDIVGGAEALKG
ncbi:ATP synthase F1 subcomplex gamma subunit [Candidatus Electrothrix communis]|uniref:ATP synthase gamma chain n=1 Tax=Candidatus Electrothrix communis TaxID=1859133 RepID=A0A444J7E3_9BACT|nr:ATP synthase F1 subunit gamma [Desulfobulbus sp. US4]MCW5204393.1 ATP synthase F1 subunit gamma [Desulfobulbus sp. N2]MCW5214030.1 ATP synthase F1 subunit gamma [Desulfobulbus sp. US5]RWX48977.1 ATP synthase F1 subcomplex gamma subunit [Candidatus Electrothrix communis]